MSKKELLLVVVLVAFGLLNDFFNEHRSGIRFNFGELVDHKVSFALRDSLEASRAEEVFPALERIDLRNAAGEIVVRGSTTGQIKLVTIVRIADRWKSDKEWLLKQVGLEARENEGVLEVSGKLQDDNLVNKMRIFYELEVPVTTSVSLSNRFGDVFATDIQQIVALTNRYGNVRISGITGAASVELKFGNLEAVEIGGALEVSHRYGEGDIKGAASVKYDGKYCDYSFRNVANTLEIDDAYSKIAIDGSRGVTLRGRFTSLQAENVAGDLNIENSYRRIRLQNVRGNLVIRGKSNQIDVRGLIGRELDISNSYQRISLEDLQLEKAVIDGKYCSVRAGFLELGSELVGKGSYCNWELVFPVTIAPQLLIKNRGGDFTNNSHINLTVKKSGNEFSVESEGAAPRVSIENSYGDIVLMKRESD